MDTKQVDFQDEIKTEVDNASLLSYENTEGSSSEFVEKQIKDKYFVSKTIKQEHSYIKSEEDQFSANGFNEKQIQDNYFDFKSIKQDEIEIKTENEEDEFIYEPSAGDSEKRLPAPIEGARLIVFLRTNNNHSANLEGPPLFKCSKCSYQTHQKELIKQHVISHLPKTFDCPLCPYKSSNKDLLSKHQLVHKPAQEAEMHKCPQCLFTSKKGDDLTNHLLIHNKLDKITWYQCPELKHKLQQHRNGLPMYKCTLCSYVSLSKDNLQSHINRVHNPKNHLLVSCPEEGCLYKTRKQSYLRLHIGRMHRCTKILKCPKCPFQTKYIAYLKTHKLKHEKHEKCFSCSVCPFKTTHSYSLTKHALVHKNDCEIEWFQCSKCSYKTKHKGVLKQHKVKHSSETGESAADGFFCYVCRWRGGTKQSLVTHIRRLHRD